ncbi:TolC family protein [Gracilimonas amylolytica]|uniref:TolC family protein n=1 Tax=Gracilimonas amylolytica TaxID=1749045 RepID=UPI000CD8B2A8|nr:TolC family protein [Gracilimonas amylolytica]
MNSSKWWILFLVFLWVPLQVHAQSQTLSLEDVVERFKQHSLQQELAELDKLRKQGTAQQYKSYMNPEVSIFSEQLNSGTLDYDETTYQISQPIELLGQPFLRNKSANKSSEAAEFSYEYNRSVLIQQVKSLYAEYWFLQHKFQVYNQALDVIHEVLASAIARQTEGTESGLQVQRFTVEKNRYLRMRNEVELEMMQTGKQLASMITTSEEAGFDFQVEADLPVEPIMEDSETLKQYALEYRADLQAIELEAEALGLKYKVEKRERLPDLKVNFGYKNQSDGSEGFVIGGGIQLPIFNRNSGNITVAKAEQRSVETSLHIQRRAIRDQVDVAYQRVQNLYTQWQEMQQHSLSAEMLETARSAYQEGRYSLVELLDATKAYVDGRSLQHRITADYQQALFMLDTITSGKIFSTQNTSEQ